MYRCRHRSITTPSAAVIVEAKIIAKYDGINKLNPNIITMTQIIRTK